VPDAAACDGDSKPSAKIGVAAASAAAPQSARVSGTELGVRELLRGGDHIVAAAIAFAVS
jgi:hypothetical protein